MNYFAHALPFLDEPYFAAGTAVPDWLAVADRRVRVRPKVAEQWAVDRRRPTALVAQGIVQHIQDDRRFHAGRAFAELSLEVTAMVRGILGADTGFRAAFLGHLLVEVLLDASLVAEFPEQVERYYQALDRIDAATVEQAVNEIVAKKGVRTIFSGAPSPPCPSLAKEAAQDPAARASGPCPEHGQDGRRASVDPGGRTMQTERLAPMIERFRRERILWDYLEDARLAARLNQVLRRVRLAELPEDFRELLPAARARVEARREGLLNGLPTRTEREAGDAFIGPPVGHP